MADRSINELPAALQVTPDSLFALQQSNASKKLTAQILENWLVSLADGHGGIQSIVKQSTIGLKDTYRITLADTTTFDFTVTNGKSITKIAKASTSGLVDTYRITYNDNTSSTFTVTNGAKGAKGDNAYVWFRYASEEPTEESHDFGEIPDAWIGVYSGNSATAPTDWNAYKWSQFRGNTGATGAPATKMSDTVEYQVSDSGTIVPSGTWSRTIPAVPQGKYLWTRTTIRFNTGDPLVFYSVSRAGMDGLGSVASVCGISPGSDGDVALTSEDLGALPTAGGDMTGGLNMNGQFLTGLNAPTEGNDAANKGYVDSFANSRRVANLLDNSDFCNPVNQSGSIGLPDRWKSNGGSALSTDTGINLTGNMSTGGNIYQYINPDAITAQKTYTLAVCLGDGSIYCFAAQAMSQNGGSAKYPVPNGSLQLTKTAIGYRFNVNVDPAESIILRWAALYEGSYTAETLPPYVPKGYGAELLECQRYFAYIPANMRFRASGVSANTVDFFVPIPNMRENPTIDTSALVVRTLDNTAQSDFTFTIQFAANQYGIVVRATKTAHGMSDAMLVVTKNCYINADL